MNDSPKPSTKKHKYTMTISLNVLEHLGIGLYSNIPAVLSETVANSYDADATEVKIQILTDEGIIIIDDNGFGMTLDDINEKYLTVGYKKREHETTTPKHGRKPMGRKGIGKLAVFSIANIVEVHSVKNGEVNGLRMNRSKIKEHMNRSKIKKHIKSGAEYHPTEIPSSEIGIDHGTRIILSELDNKLNVTKPYLKKRLARRFGIITPESKFSVKINEEEITAADREYFPKIQYVWYLGDESQEYADKCTKASHKQKVDNEVFYGGQTCRLTGWIGTAEDQKSIDEENNTIVVMARGKLIQEDILRDLKEGGLFSKYVIGEINADFMDEDDDVDLVTSDRQRVKISDPRYELIRKFVEEKLKTIRNQWTNLRRESGANQALTNPILKEWFDGLTPDNRKVARKLFGKIYALSGLDNTARSELLKYSIFAFEKLALQGKLGELEKVQSIDDFKVLKSIFNGIDEIESTLYYQIIKGRIGVLQKFKNLVDQSKAVKEAVLQDFIFDHLWLLSPTWERASTNMRIEQSVTKEFEKMKPKLSDDERKGRIDIRYKTAAGKHIIIELKKYDRVVDVLDLAKQIRKYRQALEKCLLDKFPDKSAEIEVICILGSPPIGDDPDKIHDQLKTQNARFVTYDSLIQDTQDSYSQYLEANERISRTQELIDSLESE